MPRADVVVIGAGLAGLTCAAELAERGASVFLAAKGMATTHWTHGGLDVAVADGADTPRAAVGHLAMRDGHPYARLGGDVEAAVDAHLARTAAAGLPHVGSVDASLVAVPTALGTLRRAAILPTAQAAALEPWTDEGLLLIGFDHYRDAWAPYAARNLGAGVWEQGPRDIRGVTVELPWLERLNNLNATTLARLFEDPVWRARALAAIVAAVPSGRWRVALPAVLGVASHAEIHAAVEEAIGARAFEVASLPPSVAGMRLFDALRHRIEAAGGRIQVGFEISGVEREGRRIVAVQQAAAARPLRLVADSFVLATGGIAGAGFRGRRDGTLEETVLGLEVSAPPHEQWFSEDPLVPHPLERAGIDVDDELRPAELDNVRVIGAALAGMHVLEERCGDGVALASAHRAAAGLARARAAA
ncbi:MAG TPA: anaerobic glycerol-3-phosphate dehydrogenase subunit GlpB [Candidatus Limnocylindria bacterium]|nr:anaerobic glycerol-3-phosphate dehydrogenase subunit GlpB [Candidatus Limnocylindria bacterium]